MKSIYRILLALLLSLSLLFSLTACLTPEEDPPIYAESLADIPEFSGKAFVIINNNQPFFEEGEIVSTSYERYSPLDGLGRCGPATACVGKDLMPTEEREGSLTSVTPSGWVNAEYDIVSGCYLYNRAHLIGWQLTAETTNKENLITGTRFMNVSGMLPFEKLVADHIKEEGGHVMYRVTPIFEGNNLVASGVLMEARSVEDGGEGVTFCVYVYNNQPGIRINYATGESKKDDGVPFPEAPENPLPDGDFEYDYILNTATKKIHKPDCHHATGLDESKREYTKETVEELEAAGYSTCGTCFK